VAHRDPRFREDRLLGPREIAQMLIPHADAVARDLFPDGRKAGRWWQVGSLDGEKGQSLRIELSGGKRGRWKDYTSGEYGDLLDLFTQRRGGGDPGKGFAAARFWLGLGDRRLPAEESRRLRAESARRQAELKAQAAHEVDSNRRRAVAMWDKARVLKTGEPVDGYLKRRGIDLSRLGRAPAALRYAPSIWAEPGRRCPAMLGAITDNDGQLVSIHRTFLKVHADGIVTKAEMAEEAVKRTLGLYAGHTIKLWRGASGRSWAQMPADETVVIAEGLEDALSVLVNTEIELAVKPSRRAVVVAASELRIIAAVSGGNMLALDLPKQVSRLIVLQQRDPPGSQAEGVLSRAIDRFWAQGREVMLLPPPAWPRIKDLNDLAQVLRRAQGSVATRGLAGAP
jgi:hypothetical protein